MKPLRGTVSADLANFVASARWDDLPGLVRNEARRSLLNYFAVALGGCRDPAVLRADAALSAFTGAATATVVGRERRSDPLHAACLNAIAANVFDFDDTHPATIIHPSAPVAPALFALAESTVQLSGPELLLAFVLGVEVECRIGNAISPAHYARGWHITSTCGVFGAAAAAARVLAGDAQSIHAALGNASAQSSGLVETLGSMSKSIGVGHAARNGIVSALLARQGFDGPDEPLAGPRGFLPVFGEDPKLSAITDGLGEDWQILRNTYKPYPCGVVLNPVIEACLALAGDAAFDADDVVAIELTGAPLLRQRTDRPGVDSGRLAQVSAQHAAAVALRTGRAGIAQFSDAAVADARTRALGARLRFVDDPRYALDSARVALTLRNGRVLERTVDHARGGAAMPLTDGELRDKLSQLIAHSGCAVAAAPLIEAIDGLERCEDAGGLMRLVRPVAIG